MLDICVYIYIFDIYLTDLGDFCFEKWFKIMRRVWKCTFADDMSLIALYS